MNLRYMEIHKQFSLAYQIAVGFPNGVCAHGVQRKMMSGVNSFVFFFALLLLYVT